MEGSKKVQLTVLNKMQKAFLKLGQQNEMQEERELF